MNVRVDLSSIKSTKPHEYAVRFVAGGLITAATGLIAMQFGPVVAGLFLAFPAIFPASATLIAKHEKERKWRAGYDGTRRGRAAASADAVGTSLGCLALFVFALLVWRLLPVAGPSLILPLAGIAWAGTAVLAWLLHRKF